MSKPKKFSAKEKIEIYEAFFARLHFHRHLSMNHTKIGAMLDIADAVAAAKDDEAMSLALEAMKSAMP